MKDKPLVSIVVPSYNHEKYIDRCITSIYEQDYKYFELIVIDDGSTDKSVKILEKLKKKYGFYLECNKNQGLAKTLNRGFRDLAKGKYLTFCASDDYWLPVKLSAQVKFMEENLQDGMVYGKAKFIDSDDNFLPIETETRNKNLKGGFIFKNILLQEFHPPVNYLFRKEVLKQFNYYREHIWAEDFDMNLKISELYPIGFINDYLSCYRTAEKNANKNFNFKTIYSHLDSINQFSHSIYYKKALKNWYYKCFLWYSPLVKGKKLALIGMLHNLDKMYKKEFIIYLLVLIRKWK